RAGEQRGGEARTGHERGERRLPRRLVDVGVDVVTIHAAAAGERIEPVALRDEVDDARGAASRPVRDQLRGAVAERADEDDDLAVEPFVVGEGIAGEGGGADEERGAGEIAERVPAASLDDEVRAAPVLGSQAATVDDDARRLVVDRRHAQRNGLEVPTVGSGATGTDPLELTTNVVG